MIKCSSCGHENVPGTQFCEGCGEELPQDNAAASSNGGNGGDSAQNMIKCPACDNMNPADNVACEVCGAELSGVAGSQPADVTPNVTASANDSTLDAAIDNAVDSSLPIAPIPADVASPDAAAVGQGTDAPVDATTPAGTPDTTALTDANVPDVAPAAIPDVSLPVAPVGAPAMATDAAPTGDLAPGKVKLVVEQGQTIGAQFVLGDAEMLVGREDEEEDIYPDIDLSDQDAGYVHRKHATLRFHNGALSVEHLGGSNKTRVNNKPIGDNDPQSLKVGDKVSFGKVVLRVLPV